MISGVPNACNILLHMALEMVSDRVLFVSANSDLDGKLEDLQAIS